MDEQMMKERYEGYSEVCADEQLTIGSIISLE